MTMTLRLEFGPDERCAPTAFASQVGRTVPVNLPGGDTLSGIITAARVEDDGRSVALTVEVR